MSRMVYGIFGTRTSLEFAVNRLKGDGFRNTDVSVLFPHNTTSDAKSIGSVLGGALGWLAGIGALAIPGQGAFTAGGPILAALAGAGLGGSVGGIAGALIGMGVSEYEAKRTAGRVCRGDLFIAVHVDGLIQVGADIWLQHAKQLLYETGADDIASLVEQASV